MAAGIALAVFALPAFELPAFELAAFALAAFALAARLALGRRDFASRTPVVQSRLRGGGPFLRPACTTVVGYAGDAAERIAVVQVTLNNGSLRDGIVPRAPAEREPGTRAYRTGVGRPEVCRARGRVGESRAEVCPIRLACSLGPFDRSIGRRRALLRQGRTWRLPLCRLACTTVVRFSGQAAQWWSVVQEMLQNG